MRMVKVRILPPQPRLTAPGQNCVRIPLVRYIQRHWNLAHAKTHPHAHIGSRYINLGERT